MELKHLMCTKMYQTSDLDFCTQRAYRAPQFVTAPCRTSRYLLAWQISMTSNMSIYPRDIFITRPSDPHRTEVGFSAAAVM